MAGFNLDHKLLQNYPLYLFHNHAKGRLRTVDVFMRVFVRMVMPLFEIIEPEYSLAISD